MDNKKIDELSKICDAFNSAASKIAILAELKLRGTPHAAEIVLLKEELGLVRRIDPTRPIALAARHVLSISEGILARDEDCFLNYAEGSEEIRSAVKHSKYAGQISSNGRIGSHPIIMAVKRTIPTLDAAEKNEIWRLIQDVLNAVLEYKMLGARN